MNSYLVGSKMMKKFVAILLAFASIDLGLSFDKYTTEILNGEFFKPNYNYIIRINQYFRKST